jgi:hypothetical protein
MHGTAESQAAAGPIEIEKASSSGSRRTSIA